MSEYSKKAGVRKLRSVNALVSELEISEVKGALYNLFHHTGIDAFVKMTTGGSVWLSRIDQMNDGTEVFKDADRTYAFCLTAKPTENVGMQYVGYVSRDGRRVHVRDKIYQIVSCQEMSREDIMNKCGSYIKRLGWAYEHEIRLVVRLDERIAAPRVQLAMPDVFEKLLTYKPRKKGNSCGMPSVIVGPWGEREKFKRDFLIKAKKLICAEREDVRYFLSHTDDEGGLVRESEYKDEIRLGYCEGCKRLRSCKCDYCEGGHK